MKKKKPLKNKTIGDPIDQTWDSGEIMGDTYGLTGLTISDPTITSPEILDELEPNEESEVVKLLNSSDKDVIHKLHVVGNKVSQDVGDLRVRDLIIEAGGSDITEATPTDRIGEYSISGDMPDPESDGDTLFNSHLVGLRLDEDEDNPQELNMAADVSAAELMLHGIDGNEWEEK